MHDQQLPSLENRKQLKLASVNIAFLSLLTTRLVLGIASVLFLMLSYMNTFIVLKTCSFRSILIIN